MQTENILRKPLPELSGQYSKIYRLFRKYYKPIPNVKMEDFKKLFLELVNNSFIMYEVEELNKGGRSEISYPEVRAYGRVNEKLCFFLLLNYWNVDREDTKKYLEWFYRQESMSYSKGHVTPGGPTNRWNKNIFH